MNPLDIPYMGPYYPSYAPEWSSGGIYGLHYHKGALLYTVAFDALTIIYHKGRVKEYRYELIGEPPRSGGDTYGAAAGVDDTLFFGGWVHAPAHYDVAKRKITFHHKYSHLHRIDLRDMEVSLMYKDGPGLEDSWSAEISDILYNPVEDSLILFRGDGHFGHGVYTLDREGRRVVRLSSTPVLRGTFFLDQLIAGVFCPPGFTVPAPSLQIFDMENKEARITRYDTVASADGSPPEGKSIVALSPLRNKLYAFVDDGIFVGDPTGTYNWNPDSVFIRLFATGEGVARYSLCRRVKAVNFGGGLLVPVTKSDIENSPTPAASASGILLFIDDSYTKIIHASGRITGLAATPDSILLATASSENTQTSTRIDYCFKQILKLPHDIINRNPPPISLTVAKQIVNNEQLGGIPLTGYLKKRAVITLSSDNRMIIREYDLSTPQDGADTERYMLKKGRNEISLDGFGRIVSFKFEKNDKTGSLYLYLA